MTSIPQGDVAQQFIEQLLRTGLALIDLLASLVEEMPDRVEGEDSAAVLIEMVAGTCRPALCADGEESCRNATALIGTVWERVVSDLRVAAAMAEPNGHA